MKIALISCHTKNYNRFADVTWQNKIEYATRWNYDTYLKVDDFKSQLINFERCYMFLDLFKKGYDWVCWTDSDMHITNHKIPLTQFIYDASIVTSCDFNGLNNGFMFVSNTELSKTIIKKMIELEPIYKTKPFKEQQILMENQNNTNWKIKVLPQMMVNSYDYKLYCPQKGATSFNDCFGYNGNWQPGHFIIHYPDQKDNIREQEIKNKEIII